MKIIHLEASPGWGGQEMRILKESEAMRAQGHEVIIIVMKQGVLAARARSLGFTVYECHFQKTHWLFTLPFLCYIFLQSKADLINTHSSLDGWIGGIAARICRIPVVRTRHLSTPIKKGWNSKMVYGKLADFVVTTCQAIVPIIVEQSGQAREKVVSIATGIDPAKMIVTQAEALEFREKLKIAPTDFVVGTACFMRSWKGISDLLKAAALLRHVPRLKFVIIGGGFADVHKAEAKELQLEDRVHFVGHLENPFPALKALDVFTLLSTAHEGVSQAILQAAFLHKPLIATSTGGLQEVCIPNQTGFLVPNFSPQQVALAIQLFYKDPKLCSLFGDNAHLLVSKNFTLQKTIQEMSHVYERVVN